MKIYKIIYWISTGLLCLIMLMSAGMYIFNHSAVAEGFSKFGYPAYVIYPLAIAKILGVAAILSKVSKNLKEWAYAGFFFNFLLAFAAHLSIGDGVFTAPFAALALLFVSYSTDRQIYGENLK